MLPLVSVTHQLRLPCCALQAEKAFAKARPQHCLILLGWVGSLLRVVPIPAAAKAAEALAKVQVTSDPSDAPNAQPSSRIAAWPSSMHLNV